MTSSNLHRHALNAGLSNAIFRRAVQQITRCQQTLASRGPSATAELLVNKPDRTTTRAQLDAATVSFGRRRF